VHKASGRIDVQFSSDTHFTVRANLLGDHNNLGAGDVAAHPSTVSVGNNNGVQGFAKVTQVLNHQAVNEATLTYNGYVAASGPIDDRLLRRPQILLRGLTIGKTSLGPSNLRQDDYSVRDMFTYTFNGAGRHVLKVGGDYAHNGITNFFCATCDGVLDATGGPIPANIGAIFPVWNDPATWNLAALSPITLKFTQDIDSSQGHEHNVQHWWSTYVQDDWEATRRLTVNVGFRYDVGFGYLGTSYAPQTGVTWPFLPASRPTDHNNVAPRLGAVYALNDRTVVRGGWGLFFAGHDDEYNTFVRENAYGVFFTLLNDGRADFAANPYNGKQPTAAEAAAINTANNVLRSWNQIVPPANFVMPYTHQASAGVQRQFGDTMSLSIDYAYQGGRNEVRNRNTNLTYNPATGANYPFGDQHPTVSSMGHGDPRQYRRMVQLPFGADRIHQAS
jgi:hypothetical protein